MYFSSYAQIHAYVMFVYYLFVFIEVKSNPIPWLAKYTTIAMTVKQP